MKVKNSRIQTIFNRIISKKNIKTSKHQTIKRRKRKFTPQLFFLTIMKIVESTNIEGYTHALSEVFEGIETPFKSALCKLRKLISYNFFKRQLEELIERNSDKRKK